MAAWRFRFLVLAVFLFVVIAILLVNGPGYGRPALSHQGHLTEKTSQSITTDVAKGFLAEKMTQSITTDHAKDHENVLPAASKTSQSITTDLAKGHEIVLSAAATKVENSLMELPLSQAKLRGEPPDYFKPRAEVVNPLVTDYSITPRVCDQSQPYLLILQMSVLDDFSTRAAVRKTWASVAERNAWPQRKMNSLVKMVFVVGHKVGSQEDVRNWGHNLTAESASHGDILYMNMNDTYRNLTLKVLSSFYWANVSCPGMKFVTKADADTFVNVPLLVDTLMLAEVRLTYSIVGFVYGREASAVMRGGQWAVSESQFPMSLYPEYASGCAYVLSQKAVSSIVGAAPYVTLVPVEDVFVTGIMRYVISCKLFSLPAFFTHHLDRLRDRCVFKRDLKIMATGCNIEKLKEVWDTYLDDGLCS